MSDARTGLALVLGAALSAIPPVVLFVWHLRVPPKSKELSVDFCGLGAAVLACLGVSANLIPFLVFTLSPHDAVIDALSEFPGRWGRAFLWTWNLTTIGLVFSPGLALFVAVVFGVELWKRRKRGVWRPTATGLAVWALGIFVMAAWGVDQGFILMTT